MPQDPHSSFIAFKVPARIKIQLERMARHRGTNLSALLRSQCMHLLQQERNSVAKEVADTDCRVLLSRINRELAHLLKEPR